MKRNQFYFKGKVAIVTGGVQGIGRAIAETLAYCGATVVIADIQRKNGRKAAKLMRENGLKAVFVPVDLRKENDIKKIISTTMTRFGHIDILVNNARPRLQNLSFNDNFKEWDLAMDILLRAPALVIKYALPHLIKAKRSSIINVASTNAFLVSHQPLSYHVAKAGLTQLTRHIAFQFGHQGIRANVICPALVDLSDVDKPLTSDGINNAVVKLVVPLNRAAVTSEIADTVAFLCADNAAYITGQVITIDGGLGLGEHFHIARKAFKAGLEQTLNHKKSRNGSDE